MKFETSEYNNKEISKWLNEHIKTCKYWQTNKHGLLPQGASGGAITYSFTPTTIGLVTEIRCCCGDKSDVTDYNE